MPELCPDCLEFVCECPPAVRAKRERRVSPKPPLLEVAGFAPYVSGTEVSYKPIPQEIPDEPSIAWNRNPHGVGRGPTGRLRNFKAMNDEKLISVYDALRRRADDTEAIAKAGSVINQRGLTERVMKGTT